MVKKQIKTISLNAILLSLLCASAFTIQVGLLSFTLQLLIVFIIGYMLNMRNGLIVVSSYIILGLIGLPVFSNYSGGLGYVYQPTFGFIYSFLACIIIINLFKLLINEKTSKLNKIIIYSIAAFFAIIGCYLIGGIHGYCIMNFHLGKEYPINKLLMVFILPYIPFDIAKAGVAIFVTLALENQLKKYLQN